MFYPLNWVKCNEKGKNICSWIYAPPSCCRIYSVALLKIYTCMSVCENTTKQLVQTSICSWCWGRWQTLLCLADHCAALFMLQRGKRVWAHAEYLKENKDSFSGIDPSQAQPQYQVVCVACIPAPVSLCWSPYSKAPLEKASLHRELLSHVIQMLYYH